MKYLSLLLLIALPVQADIYKCKTPTGEIVFQQQPCGRLSSEPYQYREPSVITGPDTQPQYDRQYQRPSPAYQRYEQRIEEHDQKWCQFYQDRLTSANERWETQRRKGYTQDEKDRYQQRIRDAERAVERNCN